MDEIFHRNRNKAKRGCVGIPADSEAFIFYALQIKIEILLKILRCKF